MPVNLDKPAVRRRHYRTVHPGETIYSHGVPLVVINEVQSRLDYRPGDAIRRVYWFVGQYQGVQELGRTSGLYPFVRRYGDDWTFQRADWCAYLYTSDNGATWHQGN